MKAAQPMRIMYLVICCATLSACAPPPYTLHKFDGSPLSQAEDERIRAECGAKAKLARLGAEQPHGAVGSPAYVAGASLGAGISNAARMAEAERATLTLCMSEAGVGMTPVR